LSKTGLHPLAVTVKEASELTRLGVTSLYLLIKEGRLQSIKIGTKRLILISSIEALLRPEPKPAETAPVKRRRGRPRKQQEQPTAT
jgi:excisionase family DNA binding protein